MTLPPSSPRKRGSIFLSCLSLWLAAPLAASGVHFTDVTHEAGIRFVHESGREGGKLLPETLGSGVAFFDADGDGWLDLFFVNSRKWKAGSPPSLPALYLNQKDGTFREKTSGSGLDTELYGIGVAVADFDKDGRDDLYLTALEGDRLYKNLGGGKFEDVTKASGIANQSFGTSAAWLDYNKDGQADLFVANYVTWSAEKEVSCSMDGSTRSYCTPEVYPGISSKLYRGLGNGRFADVTAAAGLADPTCKALGVAVLDFDGDGWSDLFLANDTQPNKLYKNLGNGTFAEVGLEAGVAFAENGKARGAMGVDAGDYDGSGRPHLVVGNFTQEMLALYRNEGEGLFLDQAPGTPAGRASALSLTFAVFFFDAELDGDLDIVAVNGHLDEGIERVDPRLKYAQPPLLLENRGQGRFEPISAGEHFARPIVGRGATYGDYDKDGDLDLVITTNHGPAVLLRNDTPKGRHWLRVRTVGTKSTSNGLGAVVKVTTASGTQQATVKSGSSYASASDLALTFGLGGETKALKVEIEWPSGVKQKFENVEGGREWIVDEENDEKAAHGKFCTPRQLGLDLRHQRCRPDLQEHPTGNVQAVYNITNPRDSAGSPSWTTLEFSARVASGGGLGTFGTATLYRRPKASASILAICSALAPTTGAISTSSCTFSSTTFDFANNDYFVRVSLGRENTAQVVAAYGLRVF